MKNYLKEIQTKLNNEIKIEDLEVIDNYHKHRGHKFFTIIPLNRSFISSSIFTIFPITNNFHYLDLYSKI